MFLALSCSLMHDISKLHAPLNVHGPWVYSDTELDMIISWAIMYSNCNTFLITVSNIYCLCKKKILYLSWIYQTNESFQSNQVLHKESESLLMVTFVMSYFVIPLSIFHNNSRKITTFSDFKQRHLFYYCFSCLEITSISYISNSLSYNPPTFLH